LIDRANQWGDIFFICEVYLLLLCIIHVLDAYKEVVFLFDWFSVENFAKPIWNNAANLVFHLCEHIRIFFPCFFDLLIKSFNCFV
jgi:hypothetical protein